MRQHKITLMVLIICFVLVTFQTPIQGDDKNKEEKLPKIGDVYEIDRAKFLIVGIGDQSFEYKVTFDESFAVKIRGLSGTMVFPLKKDQVVKVDPTIPMIWIDGKRKDDMVNNKWLMKNGKNKVFILLQYIRKKK